MRKLGGTIETIGARPHVLNTCCFALAAAAVQNSLGCRVRRSFIVVFVVRRLVHTRSVSGGDLLCLGGKFPVAWVVELLVRLSAGAWTVAMLDSANSKNPDIINQLFGMIVNLPLTLTVPEALHNMINADRFFTWRARQVDCIKKMIPHLTAEGIYNVAAGGLYTVVFAKGKATTIKHASGDEAKIPDHTVINESFTMVNWWSAHRIDKHGPNPAMQTQQHSLHVNMFGSDSGFVVAVLGRVVFGCLVAGRMTSARWNSTRRRTPATSSSPRLLLLTRSPSTARLSTRW